MSHFTPSKWASSPFANSLVIGFGHKARHGKDYVAKTLAETYRGVRVVRFAGALYDYCRVVFGMRRKDPQLLQTMGTDVLRRQDPDIFVRVLYDTLVDDPPPVVVIPDVRFPNEAQMIKDVGGFVVKVVRVQHDSPNLYQPYVAADRDPQHSSETALDGLTCWDARIIARSGDLGSLESQAHALFAELQTRRAFPHADDQLYYGPRGLDICEIDRERAAAGLSGPVQCQGADQAADGYREPTPGHLAHHPV